MKKLLILVHLAAGLQDPGLALHATRLAVKDIHMATRLDFEMRSDSEAMPAWNYISGRMEDSPAYFARLRAANPVPLSRRRINLYLVPPQETFAAYQVPNGAAFLCGLPHGQGEAFASVINSGATPTQITRYAIEHELLHVLGAEHHGEIRNVMMPGNFAYVSRIFPRLQILRRTKREIGQCTSSL